MGKRFVSDKGLAVKGVRAFRLLLHLKKQWYTRCYGNL